MTPSEFIIHAMLAGAFVAHILVVFAALFIQVAFFRSKLERHTPTRVWRHFPRYVLDRTDWSTLLRADVMALGIGAGVGVLAALISLGIAQVIP